MIVIIDLHCDASLPLGAFEFGGGNKYSRNLISLLLAKNFSFIYFTHRRLEVLEHSLKLGPEAFFIRLDIDAFNAGNIETLQKYYAKVIQAVEDELSKHKNYCFIFHSIYWYSGEVAMQLAKHHDTFFIHTIISNGKSKLASHANDENSIVRLNSEQSIFNSAKYIICSSEAEAADIEKYYHITKEKLRVTGRWIEKEFFMPYSNEHGNPKTYCFTQDMPTHYINISSQRLERNFADAWWSLKAFIYVGRIHENKGISQIIKAWGMLHEIYKEQTPPLWIVGGTPYEIDTYKKNALSDVTFIETAEKQYKLVWWGTLSASEVSVLMGKSLALVMHSKYEAGGNVILEAMSRKLPVIATPYGYGKDYIQSGKNGYLVPFNDVTILMKCMQLFIRQPYLSNYMGRIAYADMCRISEEWDFNNAHLALYGLKIKQVQATHPIIPIAKDSVDIYPYVFKVPEENFIYQIIVDNTDYNVLNIQCLGNIENYYLWEITTTTKPLYFYFLYSIINWRCLSEICHNYVISCCQRIDIAQIYCKENGIRALFVDKSEGYLLLNRKVSL